MPSLPSAAPWLVALVASVATGVVHAQPTAERDPGNHYILECPDCPLKALETAIGSPTGIATDARGNVYFTSQHVAFVLRPDGALYRIAGIGVPGDSGDGGPAIFARLNIRLRAPLDAQVDFQALSGGIAVDDEGRVYIADAHNNRIRRVDTNGMIATVTDATGEAIDLAAPQGVAIGAGGDLYIVSDEGVYVRRPADGALEPFLPNGCFEGSVGEGSCWPAAVAVDASGAVYFSEAFCRVRRWTASGGTTTVAGVERPNENYGQECGYGGDGVAATTSRVSQAGGLDIDRNGQLFIADTSNGCIRKVDLTGTIRVVAGICHQHVELLGDDSWALDARLLRPRGVAVDPDGNVYIADTGQNRIRKVTPDGIITTVAGNGDALTVMQVDSAVKAP